MKELMYMCPCCDCGVSQNADHCPSCGEDFKAPSTEGTVLNPVHPDYRATVDNLVAEKVQASHDRAMIEQANFKRGVIWTLIAIALLAAIFFLKATL